MWEDYEHNAAVNQKVSTDIHFKNRKYKKHEEKQVYTITFQ